MAAIYSTRLAKLTLTSSSQVGYTVPAGSLAVLKFMTLGWGTLARTSGQFQSYLGGTNERIWIVDLPASNVGSASWSGYLVLPAGESLRALATATGTVVWTASGYVFAVP